MRFALALTLLVIAGPALAKKPPPPAEPTKPTLSSTPVALMFAGFDRDGDTWVTRAEFDAGIVGSFKSGDANADGDISLLELAPWSTTWLGNAFALPGLYDFDRDENDRISAAEFRAELARRFDAMDSDRDGILARAELIVLTMQRPEQGRQRSIPSPPAAPPR